MDYTHFVRVCDSKAEKITFSEEHAKESTGIPDLSTFSDLSRLLLVNKWNRASYVQASVTSTAPKYLYFIL